MFVNGNLVAWTSKKQKCVVLSSAEAEYISLAECVKSVIWIRRILQEIGNSSIEHPTTIYEDNSPYISWVSHPGKRSRHVSVRYHFWKTKEDEGEVNVKDCSTHDMKADILTKALGPHKFHDMKKKLISF